ncbi:MAG: VTT domain-containing protein [Candidatus Methanoperedens sp.]|nr:VTT domain-containing protein [Candidatus Methanoperedens sp.]
MQEKTKGIIQIVFSILIAMVVLFASSYLKHFSALDYLGVFIISLLSAATLFIPAPSWVFVVSMGRILNPYIVGLAAGIGSGLGEITGYIAGQGISHIVQDSEKYAKYKNWIKKNDLLAIGILAFIPNPLFDIAGLAAGNLGIKVWRFIAPCIVGRTIRYIILAYMGEFSINYL